MPAAAEIFGLLADAARRDHGVAGVLLQGSRIARALASTAGPAAGGIIANSNRRLLAHLRARDVDAAEHEMRRFLSCLHFTWRLTRCSGRVIRAPRNPGAASLSLRGDAAECLHRRGAAKPPPTGGFRGQFWGRFFVFAAEQRCLAHSKQSTEQRQRTTLMKSLVHPGWRTGLVGAASPGAGSRREATVAPGGIR